MKQFFTVSDVELAISLGNKTIIMNAGDTITSAAREHAQQKGITFSFEDSNINNTKVQNLNTEPSYDYQNQSYSFFQNVSNSSLQSQIQAPVQNYSNSRFKFNGKLNELEVDRWREEFPILKTVAHAANCSQSAQSKRVRAAINNYLDNWLTVGMDWNYWVEEVAKAKAEFAKIINADPSEISVSTSVSEVISSIASCIDFSGPRKKIVATEAEFPTVGHVWLAFQKYGGKVDFVPVTNNIIRLEDYERYVDDQTVLTSVAHVYYQNGFKQDIDSIVDICHRKGSLVLVDAYQSIGTTPIDVKKQKIDILTSGNLKYLFGIPGIAFLYVNKDLIPMLKPAVTGWFGQENPFSFKVRILDYACDARRFDTGTPPVLTSFAAKAGMEIINEVGVPYISERIDFLSKIAIDSALELGLKLVSPTDISKKGSTTAIELTMDSHKMESELRNRNIICSARGNVIRVAPHFYTKPEEIVHIMEQIRDIKNIYEK